MFFKNEEEYRLYNEIKYRITKPEYVENPFGFKVNRNNIFFDNKEIIIMSDSKIIDRISFSDMLKYPHEKFRYLQEMCFNKS